MPKIPLRLRVAWTKISFSGLTLVYFVYSVGHFVVQLSIQVKVYTTNYETERFLERIIHDAGTTNRSFPFLQGSTLRLCSYVPATLDVNIESCPIIWDATIPSPFGAGRILNPPTTISFSPSPSPTSATISPILSSIIPDLTPTTSPLSETTTTSSSQTPPTSTPVSEATLTSSSQPPPSSTSTSSQVQTTTIPPRPPQASPTPVDPPPPLPPPPAAIAEEESDGESVDSEDDADSVASIESDDQDSLKGRFWDDEDEFRGRSVIRRSHRRFQKRSRGGISVASNSSVDNFSDGRSNSRGRSLSLSRLKPRSRSAPSNRGASVASFGSGNSGGRSASRSRGRVVRPSRSGSSGGANSRGNSVDSVGSNNSNGSSRGRSRRLRRRSRSAGSNGSRNSVKSANSNNSINSMGSNNSGASSRGRGNGRRLRRRSRSVDSNDSQNSVNSANSNNSVNSFGSNNSQGSSRGASVDSSDSGNSRSNSRARLRGRSRSVGGNDSNNSTNFNNSSIRGNSRSRSTLGTRLEKRYLHSVVEESDSFSKVRDFLKRQEPVEKQQKMFTVELGTGDTMEVNETCLWALNWPVAVIKSTRREDIVFIAFQFWVLAVSIVALLNESIPYILASFLTHAMATAWGAFQIVHTANFRSSFSQVINNGACAGVPLLPKYWSARKSAEIPSLVFNVLSLFISALLTWKLVKLFGWQTFKRIGASRRINRVYKLVVTLSVTLQLSLFFMVVQVGLWIDQLFNSVINDSARFLTMYKTAAFITLFLLVPWLAIGWMAIKRELKIPMLVFILFAVLYVAEWGMMFFSMTFRWTFLTWKFFSVMTSAAFVLTCTAVGLGIISYLNFGKGLAKYLNAEQFIADEEGYARSLGESFNYNDEKIPFPESEKAVPTFVPPPTLDPYPSGLYQSSSPVSRSVSSSTGPAWSFINIQVPQGIVGQHNVREFTVRRQPSSNSTDTSNSRDSTSSFGGGQPDSPFEPTEISRPQARRWAIE